jgi:hypothetical protein
MIDLQSDIYNFLLLIRNIKKILSQEKTWVGQNPLYCLRNSSSRPACDRYNRWNISLNFDIFILLFSIFIKNMLVLYDEVSVNPFSFLFLFFSKCLLNQNMFGTIVLENSVMGFILHHIKFDIIMHKGSMKSCFCIFHKFLIGLGSIECD